MHRPSRSRRFVLGLAAAPLLAGSLMMAAHAQGGAKQTLTGAAAQRSPQADAFIAYENALVDGGLEAATKFAAPSKVKENEEMLKMYGADSFKQMQAAKKATRVPEAQRRKQIVKVEIIGDYAYLEAESTPKGSFDVAGFEKTAGGWKVAPVRR